MPPHLNIGKKVTHKRFVNHLQPVIHELQLCFFSQCFYSKPGQKKKKKKVAAEVHLNLRERLQSLASRPYDGNDLDAGSGLAFADVPLYRDW